MKFFSLLFGFNLLVEAGSEVFVYGNTEFEMKEQVLP
jgi:hypothetical protein